eukprot:PhM_4_TR4222/c0_g1_i1/m.68816
MIVPSIEEVYPEFIQQQQGALFHKPNTVKSDNNEPTFIDLDEPSINPHTIVMKSRRMCSSWSLAAMSPKSTRHTDHQTVVAAAAANGSSHPIRQWFDYLHDDESVTLTALEAAEVVNNRVIAKTNTAAKLFSWTTAYAPATMSECILPFSEANNAIAVSHWLKSWGMDSKSRVEESTSAALLFRDASNSTMRSSPRIRQREEEERLRLASRCGYFPTNGQTTNALVFSSGPGTCLKTFIYTVANEANLRVVEINTSQNRSAKSLSNVVNDVAQSHGIQRKEVSKNIWEDFSKAPTIHDIPDSSPPSLPAAKPAEKTLAPTKKNKPGRPPKKSTLMTQDTVNTFFAKKTSPKPQPAEVELIDSDSGDNEERQEDVGRSSKRSRNEMEIEDKPEEPPAVVVEETPSPPLPAEKPTRKAVPLLFFESADSVFDDEVSLSKVIQSAAECGKCPVIVTCKQGTDPSDFGLECPVVGCFRQSARSGSKFIAHPTIPSEYFFCDVVHLMMICNANGVALSDHDIRMVENQEVTLKALLPNLQFFIPIVRARGQSVIHVHDFVRGMLPSMSFFESCSALTEQFDHPGLEVDEHMCLMEHIASRMSEAWPPQAASQCLRLCTVADAWRQRLNSGLCGDPDGWYWRLTLSCRQLNSFCRCICVDSRSAFSNTLKNHHDVISFQAYDFSVVGDATPKPQQQCNETDKDGKLIAKLASCIRGRRGRCTEKSVVITFPFMLRSRSMRGIYTIDTATAVLADAF